MVRAPVSPRRGIESHACVGLVVLLLLAGLGCHGAAPESAETGTGAVRLTLSGHGVDGSATVALERYDYRPGDRLRAAVDLEIRGDRSLGAALRETGKIYLVLGGTRRYNGEGRLRQEQNVFCSTTLTPTGLPVEHFAPSPYVSALKGAVPDLSAMLSGFYRSDVEVWGVVKTDGLQPFRGGWQARGLKLEGTLPEGLAEGYYRFGLHLLVPWKGGWLRLTDLVQVRERFDGNFTTEGLPVESVPETATQRLFPERYLPNVRIGSPAPPHGIWTLLAAHEANGIKGAVAEEDKGRFQFSLRRRVPAPLLLPPGKYRLEPDFPEFTIGAIARDLGPAHLMPERIPSFHVYPSGELSVSVQDPAGNVHDLGPAPFVGASPTGATTGRAEFLYDFSAYGEYVVSMRGWIEDRAGHRYQGGGTYRITIAQPITFSTAVKPGTPFFVGEAFPWALAVHPPVPADIQGTLVFLPYSREDERIEKRIHARTNRFGYLEMEGGESRFVFPSPGEYRSRVWARYRSPDGVLWAGVQDSASVVAPRDSLIRVHGHKLAEMNRYEDLGFRARGPSLQEGSFSITLRDFANCFRLPMPYYSGDVGYLASTMDGGNSFTSMLTWADRSGGTVKNPLRQALEDRFPLPQHDTQQPTAQAPPSELGPAAPVGWRTDGRGRLNMRVDYPMVDLEREPDMLPFLYVSQDGRSPFVHPEAAAFESYFYLSAIRPGFIPQFTVSDSTLFQPYWETSPDRFGGQINVGSNGDLPGDMYRFLGGAVIRDRLRDEVHYGIYSTVGMVIAPGSNANRIAAPGAEPLLEMNGRQHHLMFAVEAAQIHEVGESFALSGTVLPTVPAEVSYTVWTPDGRTLQFRETANPIGRCYLGRVVCSAPGIYRLQARVAYEGKTGDILGTGDGTYHHYVVERDERSWFSLESPAAPVRVRADEDLHLRFEVDPEVQNPTVHYTVLMPGIVMDQGEIPVPGGEFGYVFSPRATALQFSSYDVRDHVLGKDQLVDTVVFVFFLEGETSSHGKVYDVKKAILRGDRFLAAIP